MKRLLNKSAALALAFAGLLAVDAQAQVILAWDFNGNAGSELTDTADVFGTNISNTGPSGVISRGAGNNPATNGGRFNANGWTETSLANAIAADDFFEWTITADSGFQINLDSITFNFQRSGTGPTEFAIRSSLDSFASDVATFTGLANGTTQTVDNTTLGASFNAFTTATFRFYGFGSTNAGGSAGFEGTGNDLILNGAVTAVPEPSTLALISLGLGMVYLIRHRRK